MYHIAYIPDMAEETLIYYSAKYGEWNFGIENAEIFEYDNAVRILKSVGPAFILTVCDLDVLDTI